MIKHTVQGMIHKISAENYEAIILTFLVILVLK